MDIILAIFVTSSLWQIICQSSSLASLPVESIHQSMMSRLWISFFQWYNYWIVCLISYE